jgi:hypothetical protein
MADDGINDDVTDEVSDGFERIEEGGAASMTSGAQAAGNDPSGMEPSGVAERHVEGEADVQTSRAGDWNPGEQSGGGGGELY